MAKLLGYIISLIGLAGIALTFEPIKKASGIILPAQLTPLILTIASVIILLVGLFLVSRSSSVKAGAEVPIYHGKQIVGYRRH